MTLKLTIACDEFDHIRALINGTVKPEGIELYFTTELTNPERHGRMVDVCELNAPTLCCARARRADHRPPDLKIERLTRGTSVLALLLNGELSAIMLPQTPKPLLEGDPRIARLFPDYVPRERAYFKQTGIFPIMHVTAIKCDIVDRYPWVPGALFRAFVEAKEIAYRRMENVRIVTLPWFGAHWEDERALFGPNPWQYRG
ncbi:MAG: 4,5-dihydroxyphthalate decarboxylase [Alphaproteobacteria bacterium]|jgi:hypothetical protein|nr:4,5-dihydroxyphthalate decarboxylase [Alphaproteobacteria bacterium]